MNGKVDVQKLMLYYYLSNLTLSVETPVYRQPCSIQCTVLRHINCSAKYNFVRVKCMS